MVQNAAQLIFTSIYRDISLHTTVKHHTTRHWTTRQQDFCDSCRIITENLTKSQIWPFTSLSSQQSSIHLHLSTQRTPGYKESRKRSSGAPSGTWSCNQRRNSKKHTKWNVSQFVSLPKIFTGFPDFSTIMLSNWDGCQNRRKFINTPKSITTESRTVEE